VIHLATSPEVAGVTGRYFVDRAPVAVHPLGRDAAAAARLWAWSAERTGLPADLPGRPVAT
jgi:hypothetical protein